ncbi:sigma-70 family RNA polymerase sigma factor [Acetobacter conturbans]|uniref:RNA polymerase sigma factor n=1 Tax=Acetobacter conturbans TaxID=1737472 RepID=A0ABX0JZ79_9PROT|nr:sigma-70 family RNA polymerase sigma factor [Acetobacter conturbans]
MSNDHLLEAYLANRSRFVSLVTSMVGCAAHAEDIVQDAFIQIISAKKQGVIVFSPIAYLTTIIRRLALDHMRSSRRQIPTEIDHFLLADTGAESFSPEAQAGHREELDAVADILAALPPRTRRAFEMYRIGGYKLQEIATVLGVSTTRVHKMIQIALVACAAALPDMEP